MHVVGTVPNMDGVKVLDNEWNLINITNDNVFR